MDTKICHKCFCEQPSTYFNRGSANSDGLQKWCRSCQSLSSSKYHSIHRESRLPGMRARKRVWQQKNISSVIEKNARYMRERARIDPVFRILKNTRKRIWDALKGISKSERTVTLMGGVSEYRAHIEKQLPSGWTWENYGVTWEIDHKIPCSKFDLSDPEQQKICFHFSNTQPLGISENRSKGNRL